MLYKNTVAIIGATSSVGTVIAKSIASKYRLLLMDTVQPESVSLQNEIQALEEYADVETLPCCKSASWEADTIVVANDDKGLSELALKMRDVSNCKTVLHFTSSEENIDTLQGLLPHAKVVSILWHQPNTEAHANAFIRGRDEEAIDTAKVIIAAMACQPQLV